MEGRMRGDDSEIDLLCRACVESNLNTRMIVVAPVSTTAAQFKERIRHCHLQNFPEHGNVRIRKLSVRVFEQYYAFNEGPIGVICQGTDARFKVELDVLEQNVDAGALNRVRLEAFCGTCQRYSSSQNIECGKTPAVARGDSPEFVTPRVEDARESRQDSEAGEKGGEAEEKNETVLERNEDARSKQVVSAASLSREKARSEQIPNKGKPGETQAPEPSVSKAPVTEKANKLEQQKAMEVAAGLSEAGKGSDDETTNAGSKPPGSTGAKRTPENRRSSEAPAPKAVVVSEPSLSQAGNTRKRKAGEAGSAPAKVARVESQEPSAKLKQTEAGQVEESGESGHKAGEAEAQANHLQENNVENSASEEELKPGNEKKKPSEEANKTTPVDNENNNTPRSTNSSRPLDLCTSKNADDLCDKLITQHFSDSSISKIAEDPKPRKCCLLSSSSSESDRPALEPANPPVVVASSKPAAADDVEDSDSETSEEAPNVRSKVGLIFTNTVDSEEVHEAPPKKQASSDSASSRSVSSKSEKAREVRKGSKQAEVAKKTPAGAAATPAEVPKKTTSPTPPEVPKKTTTTAPQVPKKTTTTPEVPKKTTKTTPEVPKKTTTTPEVPKKTTTTTPEVPKKTTTTTVEVPKKTAPAEAPKKTTTTTQQQPQPKQAPAKKPAQSSSSSSESDSDSSSTDWSPSPRAAKKNLRPSGVNTRFQHYIDNNEGLAELFKVRQLSKRREEASNADVVYETQDIEEEVPVASQAQNAGKGDLQKKDQTPKQNGKEGTETPKQNADNNTETPKTNADEGTTGKRYKQKAGRNKSTPKGAQETANKKTKQKETESPATQPQATVVKPVDESATGALKRKAENTQDSAAAGAATTTTAGGGKSRGQKKQKNSRALASPPIFEQEGLIVSPPLAVITKSGRRLKGEQVPCPVCGQCFSGRSSSFYNHKRQCEAAAAARAAAVVANK